MNYQYVSIDRIFAKLIRDITDDFDEGDVIEWTGEALEFMQTVKAYEEAVAFIEVKNHQCHLPSYLHAIIQVARDNKWAGPKPDALCASNVVSQVTSTNPSASVPVALDCQGQPINAFDLAYYRPYFDLKWEYDLWRTSAIFTARFTPVRLSNHSFFNSIVCAEFDQANPQQNIYYSSVDEYTVIGGKVLRFSFKEGMIALSYLRQRLDDETGYPLIPDSISHTTAIVSYIAMKMVGKGFFSDREGAGNKLAKYEKDWDWYCKQAGNAELMPNGEDDYQDLLNQRSYILPKQNRYYGFFGNLNKRENRGYNDPNYRNRHYYYFMGN